MGIPSGCVLCDDSESLIGAKDVNLDVGLGTDDTIGLIVDAEFDEFSALDVSLGTDDTIGLVNSAKISEPGESVACLVSDVISWIKIAF